MALAVSTSGRDLLHCVLGNHVLVPLRTQLGRPLLCFEVDVVNAESFAVSIGPLEVVEETPEEVAFHRIVLCDRAMKMGEVVAQIHDAIDVVDATSRRDDVVG